MSAATGGRRPTAELLVVDLDNTLWDWFDAWSKSFEAMLERLVDVSGVPRDTLEPEIRQVHQRRGTTEYSLLLTELPALLALHPADADLLEIYDDVVHVLNKERKQATRLYDGVRETLVKLKQRGVPVIAYTESVAYWTEWRIRTLELDGLIDVLYSAPDHDVPKGMDLTALRRNPKDEYGLKGTEHRHVPRGILKPDPQVLTSIIADRKQRADVTVYVGDSLMKDIAMAQQVGAIDVYARYGVAQDRPGYELLRRVTSWSDQDVERERQIAAQPHVSPTYVIDRFADLLDLFEFGTHG